MTYSLSGTDASSFTINNSTGQLITAAPLDFETKASYEITVNVFDGSGGSDSITITVNITDVDETVSQPPANEPGSTQPPGNNNPPADPNNAPVFTDGNATARTITENTPTNTNIGNPITATDEDNDTLTYTLSGNDASAFSIDSSTGQLKTAAPLDYEVKNTWTFVVTVFDGNGSSDRINVTINIEDVDEAVGQSQSDSKGKSLALDYTKEGTGRVVFSEIMLTRLNSYSQWIELYNPQKRDVDIKDWKIVGKYLGKSGTVKTLTPHTISKSLIVRGEKTVLITTFSIANSLQNLPILTPYVYSMKSNKENHWNHNGIILELQDKEGNLVDRIGNLNTIDKIVWKIPTIVQTKRISLVRRLRAIRSQEYNFKFGVSDFGWFPASENMSLSRSRSQYYYGSRNDVSSPGYRTHNGILPVTLSAFSPKVKEDGEVVISWITESEIDNAGFNILRSEKLHGVFVKVNPKLIQGAGTTAKRTEYTWTDTTTKPNIEYYYQIEDVSFAGIQQTLTTKRLKGIHTAKNRYLTNWGYFKKR